MATTFAVPDGRVAMAATTYTGNGSGVGQSINNTVNTVSFQPDLVWIKSRSGAYDHGLNDSNRGAGKFLFSNLTNAEGNYPTDFASFNSNGFTLGTATGVVTNNSGSTYVGWQWKAGGTAVSNTAGTITSSVSANTTAGFSVVTYTGTGANATVGHGLGVAPSMVIVKNRGGVYAWPVYHKFMATSSPATWYMSLNQTSAASNGANIWVNDPTTTVFTVSGSIAEVNASTNTYVAYCWAPVAGYSAFGSYTGNGSADGPFIYTGFRPRWVMRKRTDSSTDGSWIIYDTSRIVYNANNLVLFAESALAEVTGAPIDILSNGFKLRDSAAGNTSGATYIYAAYAENPLKYANAR
jgi:hypothetical protein